MRKGRAGWLGILLAFAVACGDASPSDGPDAGAACGVDGECDDGNACTNDVCERGRCRSVPNANPCDDGDPCTFGDRCAEGACEGIVFGCSSTSDCAEAALPFRVATTPVCFAGEIGYGVVCDLPNGCGPGVDGCGSTFHAASTSGTYVPSDVSGQPGSVVVDVVIDELSASANYMGECIFHATLAAGATATATVEFDFSRLAVCAGHLPYEAHGSASVDGNVELVTEPIGSTTQSTCDFYLGYVDAATRQEIVEGILAAHFAQIQVICGSCPGCESGIRCE